MELGIGMTVIQQMPGLINGVMPKPAQTPSPDATPGTVPPPIKSGMQVYLAIDDTQAGPFTRDELIQLIRNDLLKPETLVWKVGMAAWTPASQVADVNKLFVLSKLK